MFFGNFHVAEYTDTMILLTRQKGAAHWLLLGLVIILPLVVWFLYRFFAPYNDAVMFFIVLSPLTIFIGYLCHGVIKGETIRLDGETGRVTRNGKDIAAMSELGSLTCNVRKSKNEDGQITVTYTLMLGLRPPNVLMLVKSEQMGDMDGICYFMKETFGIDNNLDDLMDWAFE